MRRNLILVTAVAVFALAGVAQAAGVLGSAASPALNAMQAKADRLEARLAPDRNEANASARRGRRGPRGLKGEPGPRGPAGPKGSFATTTRVDSPGAFLCSFEAGTCAVGSASVDCPPGTLLTGGGYTGAGILTTVTFSAPVGNGWAVIGVNFNEIPVTDFKATAVCAGA
jgi:hypothetical protein